MSLNYNIVIVDDNAFNLDLLETLLAQMQLSAVRFTSPIIALEHLQNQPCDILLTDYNMPEMNGVELVSKVYEINPSIRSAMITALRDANGKIQQESREAGAISFLTYPINYHDFQQCMEVLTQRQNYALSCKKGDALCINRDKVLTHGSTMCCLDEIQEEKDIIIDAIDTIEDCHHHLDQLLRCSSKLSYLSTVINANHDTELYNSLLEIKKFSNLIYDFAPKIQEDLQVQNLALIFSRSLKEWLAHKFIKEDPFFNVANFSQSLKADLSVLEMSLGVCAITYDDSLEDLFF